MAAEGASVPEQQQHLNPIADQHQISSQTNTAVSAAPIDISQKPFRRQQGPISPISGILHAASDFVAWFYQPHGFLIDSQLTKLDTNGIKREFVGYGALFIVLALQLTCAGPFLANALCIAYPLIASLAVFRGQSSDAPKWLIYWGLFALISLLDAYAAEVAVYWIAKLVVCSFLYLPQTQGAILVYGLAVEPVINIIEVNITKKFV